MSGPYDQQPAQVTSTRATETTATTAKTQSTQRSGARVDRQRLQNSSSSTSISSNSSQNEGRTAQAAPAAANGGGYSVSSGQSYGNSASYSGAQASTTQRRQGRYQRQVIRVAEQCAPSVRQVRRRLPTPEPDTLERVYIQKAAQEIIEEITEVPMTPPPRIKERTVVEPAGPPQVVRRVVRVPARSGGSSSFQAADQGVSFGGASFSSGQQTLGTVNCAPSVPAPAPMPVPSFQTGGFGGSNFGFQSQGFSSFGSGASFGQQFGGASFGQQSAGAGQAFCFQI